MAPTMATTSSCSCSCLVLFLLVAALLPLGTLAASRGSSSPHHAHGSHGKHSPPPPSPPPPAPVLPPPAASSTQLVRTTCNSTTYYDLCVSALAADPSSRTADVRGLSAIAVSAAAANASASAAALGSGNGNGNGTGAAQGADIGGVQALLRACAARYGEARDALGAARESIAQQDYDYAAVHVSAAAEYPQVCKALFRRQRPGEYPAELAAREVALKQLCSVALDIISLLSTTNN